ncbi:MAG: methyltransferase domain-containing protein [Candidatus Aminicenantes bacterium]|nr:methyltransferase domain-containing protein [Candidatus Aminicenantes bacterium]
MSLKFDPARRDRLRHPRRSRRLPPFKILRRLGLRRGDTFVDIGCGPGFFSLPASRIVGEGGKVVAVDVSTEMLTDLKAGAAAEGASNIVFKQVGENGAGLPANAGLYFLCQVLHELEDKRGYLAGLRRRMGPESRLAVLDYHRRRTKHGPPLFQRVSLSRLRGWLQEFGFRVVDVFDVNAEEYAVVSRIAGKGGKASEGA